MLTLLLPYLTFYGFGRKARRFFAQPFFRYCVVCAGLDVKIVGKPDIERANFFVSNHVSYLDIPLLASQVDGLFVAKSAVAGWPIIGFLAKISRTHFVSRKAVDIPQEKQKIMAQLRQGERIFLFPEGTSGNGSNVLPFKPGLLSAAQSSKNIIQPVTLVYGAALDQEERDKYAWYGEMDLSTHIWSLFKRKERLSVTVVFHETKPSTNFDCRKHLATWAESSVRAGLPAPLTFDQAAE